MQILQKWVVIGGKYFSPYFTKTNTFETISIPEDLEDFVQNVRIPRYSEIRCANDPNLPLSHYIPANRRTGVTRNGFAHFDPNPIAQTYGENIGAPVLPLCRKLKKGDLLVWSSCNTLSIFIRYFLSLILVCSTSSCYLPTRLFARKIKHGFKICWNTDSGEKKER